MTARALILATVLMIPSFALADFEGVLDSKMSGEKMNGTMRTWISKTGIRADTDLQVPETEKAGAPGNFRMVSIVKAAQPNVTYLLDQKQKTYSVMEHKPGSPAVSSETYKVKRLGKDTIAGFSCDQIAVVSSHGNEFEMCVAPDLLGGSTWIQVFQQRAQDQGLLKALTNAGALGMPIRWVSKGQGGQGAFRGELVSAKKQSVPASTFEIPAGYTKTEMPGVSPETSKKMEEVMKKQPEALEKLSPEQRKQLEEMMKKLGTGAQ